MKPRTRRILTVLSLFDHSGVWAAAFQAFGCNVIQIDLKHGQDIRRFSARVLLEELLQAFPTIDGVVGAPPCTVFASSGAHTWAAKDADGRTAAAVELVRQQMRIVDFVQPEFWAAENPVGRIGRLVPSLGPVAFSFNPCDFAGWTTNDEDLLALTELRQRNGRLTADEAEFVRQTGAYTKRTNLWGCFESPAPAEIEPVACSAQGSWTQRLGGASEATKAERSICPEGFALAFAAAQVGASLEELAAVAEERRLQRPVAANSNQLALRLAA